MCIFIVTSLRKMSQTNQNVRIMSESILISQNFSGNNISRRVTNNTRWYILLLDICTGIGAEMLQGIHNFEQCFIKLPNLYAFASQINFFVLCASVLENTEIGKNEKCLLFPLTTVLFYTVFSYFASKVRDICQKSQIPTINSSPTLTSYLKSFCKIFLEWIKAVVVVICLREQGVKYDPEIKYSFITFSYYLCTEKTFIELWPHLFELFNIQKLENMEYLYVPFVLNILTILLALTLIVHKLTYNYSQYLFIIWYFTIYIRYKDLYYNYWVNIVNEIQVNSKFRSATKDEIVEYNDVCAVCLNTMYKAKITPCKHLFHSNCLKQCIKITFECPLCKRNFLD